MEYRVLNPVKKSWLWVVDRLDELKELMLSVAVLSCYVQTIRS